MTYSTKKLKGGLLCYGCRISSEAASQLSSRLPYFYKKGFSNSLHARVAGFNIALTVSEEFSCRSPYELTLAGEGLEIVWDGGRVGVELFPRLPLTGTVVDSLAKYHAPDCITLWPSTACCYDTPESKCKFCSLQEEFSCPIPIAELKDGLNKLYERVPHAHSLNFSGATYKSPDAMLDYWEQLTFSLRTFFSGAISIEFAPPSNLDRLARLRRAGVSNIIMNLEIADDTLRAHLCPGKSAISREHYYAAFDEGVRLFGRGQVSTVLIAGIQKYSDILAECEVLTERGVIPTIMPYRPFDNSLISCSACDPDEYLAASESLAKMLLKHSLSPQSMHGCTKCGGCSLENDCLNEKHR